VESANQQSSETPGSINDWEPHCPCPSHKKAWLLILKINPMKTKNFPQFADRSLCGG
jgi:hypothetical protein